MGLLYFFKCNGKLSVYFAVVWVFQTQTSNNHGTCPVTYSFVNTNTHNDIICKHTNRGVIVRTQAYASVGP